MKKLCLKNKLFVLLLVMVSTLSLNSCGDDSNDLKTFLEKYDATSWKFSDAKTGGILYARINNDITNPFEIWLSLFQDTCFIYENLANDGTVEVLENSEDILEIKIVDNAQEYSIVKLMIVGNTLTATNEDFENGVSVDKNTFVLLKTTDNLDGLEICIL